MPRQPRNISPGQDIHTIFRSIDTSFLFQGDRCQEVMRSTLHRMKEKYQCILYAWVGMSNHHHIFNQAPTDWPQDHPCHGTDTAFPVGHLFRDAFSMFARWLNGVRKRVGGVIRDRTKTVPVHSDHQALTLLIYIFLNPVRARIVGHPRDYPFHNFSMYATGKNKFGQLFQFHPAYLRLGNSWAVRRHRFMALLEMALADWAKLRMVGISASNGMGRNKRKTAYEDFITLAESWMTYALTRIGTRAPT